MKKTTITIIKRILLGVLFSPILIPVGAVSIMLLGLVWGIEYVLTGKYNQDNGGW